MAGHSRQRQGLFRLAPDQQRTSFAQIATSGQCSYKDQTIAAGSTEVLYFLKTISDDLVSDDSEPITVRIGVTLDQSNATPATPNSASRRKDDHRRLKAQNEVRRTRTSPFYLFLPMRDMARGLTRVVRAVGG